MSAQGAALEAAVCGGMLRRPEAGKSGACFLSAQKATLGTGRGQLMMIEPALLSAFRQPPARPQPAKLISSALTCKNMSSHQLV